MLAERGYRLESFENVLGQALGDEPMATPPPGIEVRRSGDDEFDDSLQVVLDGTAHPDTQGVPWHEEFPRDMIANAERDSAAAGLERYIALRDGVIAGGAEFRTTDGAAQLARRHRISTTPPRRPIRVAVRAPRGRPSCGL
jgi:hypothetical protein